MLHELGGDLRTVNPVRRALGIVAPIAASVAAFSAALAEQWWLVPPLAAVFVIASFAGASHDLVHRSLGLPRAASSVVLSFIELLGLRSGTAYRLSHLHQHRQFQGPQDLPSARLTASIFAGLWQGVTMQARQWVWAFREHPRDRAALLAEAGLMSAMVAGAVVVWPDTPGALIYLVAVTVLSWGLPLAHAAVRHRVYRLEHHLYPSVPHHNWRQLSERLAPYLDLRGISLRSDGGE